MFQLCFRRFYLFIFILFSDKPRPIQCKNLKQFCFAFLYTGPKKQYLPTKKYQGLGPKVYGAFLQQKINIKIKKAHVKDIVVMQPINKFQDFFLKKYSPKYGIQSRFKKYFLEKNSKINFKSRVFLQNYTTTII